jgi:hypothetical protein
MLNIWFRFSGYQSHITKSKIDKNVVSNVASICIILSLIKALINVYQFIKGPLKQKYNLCTKKREKFLVTKKDLEILMTHL